MKELEYPFDGEEILTKKRIIKKALLQESGTDRIRKKIAILGGSTTGYIKDCLELFLLNYGIEPEFYESEYNKFYEDAVFDNEELEKFHPDIIYVYTTNRNILHYPNIENTYDEIEDMLNVEYTRFLEVWESLMIKYKCPIIQNNFEKPLFRLLGNRDVYDKHGRTWFISKLNSLFAEYAMNHENFYICDLDFISSDYGLTAWSALFYWYTYKYAMALPAIPIFCYNVANIIKSIYGKNKKGLVLDLDGTMWGGVIGDDGVEEIQLGPETPKGEAFTEFQEYVKKQKQLGVVLAVNSKNDYLNAVNGFSHSGARLSVKDFSSIKANWESKDKNLRDIAADLNVLSDSLVFVDDNPAERMIVSDATGALTPKFDDITQGILLLDRSAFFEVTSISKEDMMRSQLYNENARRKASQSKFSDYGEYLLSLNMRATVKAFDEKSYSRISQLTNKSNQYNLTTKRYSQADISKIAEDSRYITLYGQLEDKFGDNGIVALSIGRIEGSECHIDLWLMSCRVLKRDMEYAMMDTFVKICRERKIEKVLGYYYPTQKNSMVRDFYEKMGYSLLEESEEGALVWLLKPGNEYINKNKYIKIEEG
ncbi:MAG: HAD-IIIC family phosphatase [Ruminococcus flavefaciens]|nr:HAD-IIIC family phosphatase [Ruminococcus flavefaciens]